jgi:hypothetical protein
MPQTSEAGVPAVAADLRASTHFDGSRAGTLARSSRSTPVRAFIGPVGW